MDLKKPLCLRTDPIPNIAARKGFQYVWFVQETPLSLTVLTSALKLAGTTDYPIKACLSWPAASPLQHHQPILGLFRGTLLKDDRRKIRQHQNHRHGNLRRTFHFLLKLTLDHQMKRCILLLKTLKVKDQIKNGLNRMIHNIYIYTYEGFPTSYQFPILPNQWASRLVKELDFLGRYRCSIVILVC